MSRAVQQRPYPADGSSRTGDCPRGFASYGKGRRGAYRYEPGQPNMFGRQWSAVQSRREDVSTRAKTRS